jgi:hypothetical protein
LTGQNPSPRTLGRILQFLRLDAREVLRAVH